MDEFPEISHPALWRGSELKENQNWIHQLSPEDLTEVRNALADSDSIPTEEISPATFPLPNLSSFLKTLQHDLEHGMGMIMIRGFDPSPFSQEECQRLFLGISSHIGTAISQSARGERIFSVRDEGFAQDDPRARGPNTRKKLSFHTDRCDVIGFLCLQAAMEGGENQVVSSMAVYEEVRTRRPDLLKVLMEPYYYRRHTVDTGNDQPWCQQPVFSFHDGHYASAFLRVLIERAYALPELPDMTPIQREALDYIEEVAAEPDMHLQFRQAPGDMLFLNNWVTWHRRSEFTDHEDLEKRRHILRAWLSVPNSRPLAPWFLANYGATGPGEIRGGMKMVSN